MDFTEYQEKAFSTCTPECYTEEYLNLGYLSEVGELAGKLAKRVRGDNVTDVDIMGEIGDVSWMAAVHLRLNDKKIEINSFKYFFFDETEGICELYESSLMLRFMKIKCFCEYLGLNFNECLRMNIEKLASRQKRGVIQGDGDNR